MATHWLFNYNHIQYNFGEIISCLSNTFLFKRSALMKLNLCCYSILMATHWLFNYSIQIQYNFRGKYFMYVKYWESSFHRINFQWEWKLLKVSINENKFVLLLNIYGNSVCYLITVSAFNTTLGEIVSCVSNTFRFIKI